VAAAGIGSGALSGYGNLSIGSVVIKDGQKGLVIDSTEGAAIGSGKSSSGSFEIGELVVDRASVTIESLELESDSLFRNRTRKLDGKGIQGLESSAILARDPCQFECHHHLG
jgi:hypothetical protein